MRQTPMLMPGDGTVRRPAGAHTPSVHALLRFLEDAGFEAAPRVLGIDAQGREVLTFVEGQAGAAPSDESLAATARLIRRYHDLVAAFEPPASAVWQYQVGAPRTGIICHNDLRPANTIYAGGNPIAFIDWEFAAPAPPIWDVAFAVSRYAPLEDDERCRPGACRSNREAAVCGCSAMRMSSKSGKGCSMSCVPAWWWSTRRYAS